MRADKNQSSALKICVAVSKEKRFSKGLGKSNGKSNKKLKNQANMWSTENRRFGEKYIEKQPKTSQNSLFSAVFWSKCGDSNSRPPVPEAEKICFLNTIVYI